MDVAEYIRNKEKQKSENSFSGVIPEDKLKMYSSMSEEQLMQELFKTANASRVSGAELDSFYRSVKGFLTPEQSEKMKNLILQIKANQ